MYPLKQRIGESIFMDLEECLKKTGGQEMYEKLEKLREELKRVKKKREEADRKVKLMESKLREAEHTQILNDVTALHLTPEQLAEFLKQITAGEVFPSFTKMEEENSNNEVEAERKETEDEV